MSQPTDDNQPQTPAEQPAAAPVPPQTPNAAAAPAAGAPVAAQPEKKKMSIGARIGISALSVVVAAVVAIGVSFLFNSVSGPNKQAVIERNVEEAKKQLALPAQIDEVTTLDDITAEQDAIQYHYTLTDVDPTLVTEEALDGIVRPSICTTPETKELLDQDIAMKYTYTVADTGDIYSLEFTKADCA